MQEVEKKQKQLKSVDQPSTYASVITPLVVALVFAGVSFFIYFFHPALDFVMGITPYRELTLPPFFNNLDVTELVHVMLGGLMVSGVVYGILSFIEYLWDKLWNKGGSDGPPSPKLRASGKNNLNLIVEKGAVFTGLSPESSKASSLGSYAEEVVVPNEPLETSFEATPAQIPVVGASQHSLPALPGIAGSFRNSYTRLLGGSRYSDSAQGGDGAESDDSGPESDGENDWEKLYPIKPKVVEPLKPQEEERWDITQREWVQVSSTQLEQPSSEDERRCCGIS